MNGTKLNENQKMQMNHADRTKRSHRAKGFSLLELMIVVVLIAGITAIAWPSISRPMRKAELSEATQKLREAIEDGRYQAMMSGEPVFLQITEGDSELRSGGIVDLISGDLDESSEGSGPDGEETRGSTNLAPKAPTNNRGSLGTTGIESDSGYGAHAVTPRVWKLPENIIVTSVHWMDEDSGDDGESDSASGSTDSDLALSGRASSSSTGSVDTFAAGSSEDFDLANSSSHEKWCLPMTAQGRGRDAEITLLDKRARQTVTVSFTAATGELEIVR